MNHLLLAIGSLLVVSNAESPLTNDDFSDGVLAPHWQVSREGTFIRETSGELRIRGTSTENGWHDYEAGTPHSFAEGSFNVSIDFSIRRFAGQAHKLIYLVAEGEEAGKIGIFYAHGTGYRMQTWDPKRYSDWLRPFGTEAKEYHRLRLVYDAHTSHIKGYVDQSYVGGFHHEFKGDISFAVRAVTSASGMKMDIRFDNFEVTRDLEVEEQANEYGPSP